jgi:hypothetical protein
MLYKSKIIPFNQLFLNTPTLFYDYIGTEIYLQNVLDIQHTNLWINTLIFDIDPFLDFKFTFNVFACYFDRVCKNIPGKIVMLSNHSCGKDSENHFNLRKGLDYTIERISDYTSWYLSKLQINFYFELDKDRELLWKRILSSKSYLGIEYQGLVNE